MRKRATALVGSVCAVAFSLAAFACSPASGPLRPQPSASASTQAPELAALHCEPGFAEHERVCARIAPRVAIAGTQICAALVDGRVFCWGRDDGGQFLPWIPIGTYAPKPREIEGVRDAIDVAATTLDACAIDRAGGATCWGGFSGAPHRIEGVAGATRIIAGARHYCVLQGDRRVACWGDLGGAQIEGADRATRDTKAIPIGGVTDAVDVVATTGATCVLGSDHQVTCFGERAPSKVPAKIEGLPPIARLVASDGDNGPHLCGVGLDGGLHCWGRGDTTPARSAAPAKSEPKAEPVRFDVPSDGRAIAIGRRFACGLFGAGAVRCTSATLEAGSSSKPAFAEPLAVDWPGFVREGGESPVDLTAEGATLCASYESGHVRCVGRNDAGQIGTGEAGTRHAPKVVPGISAATRVVLAGSGACAATADGVYCWGFGQGDLTDETRADALPRKLAAPADAAWLGRSDLSSNHPVAIDGAGKLWTLEGTTQYGVPSSMVPVEGLAPVSDVTGVPRGFVSTDVEYATTPTGGVLAFDIRREEAPPDAVRLVASSVPIQGLGPVRSVRKRNQAACAVRKNGTVACWRTVSPFGQRGKAAPPAAATRPKLLEIPGLDHVEEINTAMMWCARRSDGSVPCFTINDWVSDAQPLAIDKAPKVQPALQGATALDGFHDLGALTSSGECLYQGPQYSNETFAPYVLPCAGVVSYSIGQGGCEVRANGEVACWGDNRGGRIGSGERTFVLRPEDALLPEMTFESAAKQRPDAPR